MMNVKRLSMLGLLVLLCMQLLGCGDPNRAKLVGTWGLTTADTLLRRLNDPDEASADNQATIEEEKTAPPKMLLVFQNNGQFTTRTEMGRVTPEPKRGTWEILALDEAAGTMKIKCTIGLQVTEHEIELIDDANLKMIPPNMAGLGMKLNFKRIE